MSLRDQIIKDVQSVFFNLSEFAEPHMLTIHDRNGVANTRELPMIIEIFTLDGRPIQTAEGVSAHNVIMHIDPRVLAFTPSRGQEIFIDYMRYAVTAVSNDMGVLKVSLQANGSRA
ncbi:hypothetical protein D3C74_260440 [compost metagenome]